ncbi:MAG TPA: hypothetical protein VEK80_00350 [Kribbellaceae bacterium]|nr:hypothetical protein [Kribbellaceae bacterium]
MPDVTAGAPGAMTEFEAQSWPIDAASESLAQVIEGFALGDTRPLVIGDGDRPVLVVLPIADLADFRARVTHLLSSPVDAGWLRYHLRSHSDGMSPETLVELLGVDTDHGLTSLCSQVSVEQAAVLLPDHLRRAEDGANPLMLIGDGRMATAALISYDAFAVLLDMEGEARQIAEREERGDEFEPDLSPTGLEELAARLGPVSVQIVEQINAEKDHPPIVYNLNFEADLVEHLTDLEARAQATPGGGAYDELRATLRYLDELRSGGDESNGMEAPYLEADELAGELETLRAHFRNGADDPFLVGIEGNTLAGLISYDVYCLLQQVSVELGGSPQAPVLPLPGVEGGPVVQPFEIAVHLCAAVVEDIAAGEGSMLFIADEDGVPELVLAPIQWLWAYVDHLDTSELGSTDA